MCTLVDVDVRNGHYLVINSCPGVMHHSRNSFRLRTSSLRTPKRIQRARWRVQEQTQENEEQNCKKNVGKSDQLLRKCHLETSSSENWVRGRAPSAAIHTDKCLRIPTMGVRRVTSRCIGREQDQNIQQTISF